MTPNLLETFLDEIAARVVARMAVQQTKTSSHQTSRLLDVRSAAEYLGVTDWSIRHQVKSGQLPAVRRGNRIFLDRRDLDRIIEQSKDQGVQ